MTADAAATGSRGPGFLRSVFRNTTSALADLFLAKLGTTLSFILLVRLLSKDSIGAIGVANAYLVLVQFLDVKPIVVLLRDYPKIAGDLIERNLRLTAFLVFWVFQALVMLGFGLALRALVLTGYGVKGLPFVFLAVTIDLIALTLQDLVKTVLYADFQQGTATTIGVCLGFLRLACLLALFWRPELSTYAWALIATSFLNGLIWLAVFRRRLQFRPALSRRIPGILKESLSEYGLWNHGQTVATKTLLLVDTLVISRVASLREVADYTIALSFTSVFFFSIPWQLARSLQVVLSHQTEDRGRFQVINGFLKINALISVAQLAAVIVAGRWAIRLLFGAHVDGDVFRFALITGIGATIMNFGWPLISIINTFCSLRRAFLSTFLPAAVLGVLVYVAAGLLAGATGVAYGNIVVYSIVVVGLILFLRKSYSFPLHRELITAEERVALRKLIRA
jgi:O-antigen/teichoic acid export membrane protein